MRDTICPACGEDEALRGRADGDDIAVTCENCGAEWLRGKPRCKQCGRPGAVELPQPMTRHPRGTLLAVVGQRQVPLCADCDSAVVAPALEHRRPIPEGYVSRFLFGEPSKQQAGPRAARPSTRSRPAQRPTAADRPAPRAPVSQAEEASKTLVDPTLRQATEEFLTDRGSAADSLAMVLLGGKLGPSTRLSRLDTPSTAGLLGAWVADTFRSRPGERAQAADTVRRAVGYWRERGWLASDLAAAVE